MTHERIAVLGTNSFMGRYFVDYLLEHTESEVWGCSRSPEANPIFLPYTSRPKGRFEFAQIDFNTEFSELFRHLDRFKPKYIFNFANPCEVASSWGHSADYYRTNVVATAALCDELCKRDYYLKFIHTSSPEIYGTCSGKIVETQGLDPSTPYAVSKAAGDLHMHCLAKHKNFRVVITRPTNVYGAYQQLYRIIPRSVIRLRQGETIELHGGGRAVKSYLHMGDLSRGFLQCAESGRLGEIYHFSPKGGGISIADLVRLVCKRLNCEFERSTRTVEERLGQDAAYIIDSTKARTEFGWDDPTPLEKGVDEVIDWIDRYWDEIIEQPMNYTHRP